MRIPAAWYIHDVIRLWTSRQPQGWIRCSRALAAGVTDILLARLAASAEICVRLVLSRVFRPSYFAVTLMFDTSRCQFTVPERGTEMSTNTLVLSRLLNLVFQQIHVLPDWGVLPFRLEPNAAAAAASEHGAKSTGTSAKVPSASSATRGRRALRGVLTAVERAALTLLSVVVSIFVLEFSAMMAFLGACTSFLLYVIGPASAQVALKGCCGIWDTLILVVAAAIAMWGTIAVVLVSTVV